LEIIVNNGKQANSIFYRICDNMKKVRPGSTIPHRTLIVNVFAEALSRTFVSKNICKS